MAIAITGSTGGVGRAIALLLAERGERVRIHSGGNAESRESTLAVLAKINPDAVVDCTTADLTELDGVDRLVDAWSTGPLTGLICAAGPFRRANWDALDGVDLEAMFRSNLFSTWTLLQRLMPRLREQGEGVITLLGQNRIQDLAAAPDWTAYNAAKAGLVLLVRTLCETEGPHGIRINLVNPGIIDTGNYSRGFLTRAAAQIPLRRAGTPQDVAQLIGWLHSDAASYISGAIIECNGGLAETGNLVR